MLFAGALRCFDYLALFFRSTPSTLTCMPVRLPTQPHPQHSNHTSPRTAADRPGFEPEARHQYNHGIRLDTHALLTYPSLDPRV